MPPSFTFHHNNNVITITLTGRLDTNHGPALIEELQKLVGHPIEKIVFNAQALTYISSAGLRAIMFARKKINPRDEVCIVGAPSSVIDVIKISGFDSFLVIKEN